MISVIVPARNAATTLGECLHALGRQSVPASTYEVIVVDDGSVDGTAQVAHDASARVISQAQLGPAAARNAGVAAASGDIVLFTDADCEPTPGWLAAMVAPFADPEVVGVKGTYRTRQRQLIARFVQIEYEDKYDRLAHQPSIDFVDTYSAGYRRMTYLLNGGFDQTFPTASVEDQEFSFRLSKKGYHLVFAPGAAVYHLHDSALSSYLRRKFNIGFWKVLLARWHPEKLARDSHTPQVVKAQIGLAALLLANAPLALFVTGSVLVEVLLAGLFWLSTVPFCLKAARKDVSVAILSPFYLGCRALALGAGLLAGYLARVRPSTPHIPALTLVQRIAKRSVDLILGSILLVGCLPLWLAAALAIKLDSRGSVFFVQTRVGENGRVFDLYKLRTMVEGAANVPVDRLGCGAIGSSTLKLEVDPRTTRVGRILRRTSLDETPQFINVLRGEMSLVGPRPEEVSIVALYSDWHRKRLAVKPGVTGPMQVNGRATLSLDERVRLELDYIDSYSLRKDMGILLRTIPAALGGRGSF